MWSIICVSQKISIWALNLSLFIHSIKYVLVRKYLNDNLSFVLVILEMSHIKLNILSVFIITPIRPIVWQ